MPSAVASPHLAKAFEGSEPAERRDLVLGLLRSIQKGETREASLARAEKAGWPRDFAVWIYTKVKQDGEIEILGPLDERIRAAKMAPPLILSHTLWVLVAVAAFFIFSATLGSVFGVVLVPTLWGLWRFVRRVFSKRDTGESEWVTPR